VGTRRSGGLIREKYMEKQREQLSQKRHPWVKELLWVWAAKEWGKSSSFLNGRRRGGKGGERGTKSRRKKLARWGEMKLKGRGIQRGPRLEGLEEGAGWETRTEEQRPGGEGRKKDN